MVTKKALIILVIGGLLASPALARRLSFIKIKDMAGSEAQLKKLLGVSSAQELLNKSAAADDAFKQRISLKARVSYNSLRPMAKIAAIRYAVDEAFPGGPAALDKKINFVKQGLGLSSKTARGLFENEFKEFLNPAKVKRFQAVNANEKKQRLYFYQKGHRGLKTAQYEESRQAFKKALEYGYPTLFGVEKPDDSVLYFALAMIEDKLQDPIAAKEMLQKALEANPNYREAKVALARITPYAKRAKEEQQQAERDQLRLDDLQDEYQQQILSYRSSRRKLIYVMACGAGIVTIGLVNGVTIDDPLETDSVERARELDRRKKGATAIVTIGAIELLITGGFYTYYAIRQQSIPTPEEMLATEKIVRFLPVPSGHPGQLRLALLNRQF